MKNQNNIQSIDNNEFQSDNEWQMDDKALHDIMLAVAELEEAGGDPNNIDYDVDYTNLEVEQSQNEMHPAIAREIGKLAIDDELNKSDQTTDGQFHIPIEL